MADSNITAVGNVTREPELRFTQGGQAVTKFGLAVNRRWQQGGEWKESTSFIDVVAWGQMAENVSASITKGARVMVSGRLEVRNYETQQGEKRTAVEITADEIGPSLRWATAQIERNDRKGGDGGGGGFAGSAPSRQAPASDSTYSDEEPF
ncbi:MAG: single-stranded DNA-binding protein [Acidimicrobiia bacterium]